MNSPTKASRTMAARSSSNGQKRLPLRKHSRQKPSKTRLNRPCDEIKIKLPLALRIAIATSIALKKVGRGKEVRHG